MAGEGRLHTQKAKQHVGDGAHVTLRSSAAELSDADLLTRVVTLAGAEREATVELVVHLAELDARKLYLGQGYGSLFSSLNLSTLRLLAPHLRPDNFESVVAMAKGKSKREVEVLVAHLAPHPGAASSIRRLPAPARVAGVTPSNGPSLTTAPSASLEQADRHIDVPSVLPGDLTPRTRTSVAPLGQPPDRPVVAPLAPARYRVQFTVGEATHEKLRRAQDLLRREIPDGDSGAIFDRALTLLLEEVARKKLAATSKPKVPVAGRGLTRSRHIPARVKRAVWLRDEGQCAFVASNGRRCTERAFLEFHHDEPYAVGGEATVANVSLRCHAHNIYEAELAFGPAVISAARDARARDSVAVDADSPRGESGSSCGATTQPRPQDGAPCWPGLSTPFAAVPARTTWPAPSTANP